MSQYLPRYFEGASFPMTVGSGGIVGGHPINAAGQECADNDITVTGVAGFDAPAGATVTVWREGIQTGTASGAIVLGDPLCTAITGRVRKWVAGTDAVASRFGRALSAAADAASVTYALVGV